MKPRKENGTIFGVLMLIVIWVLLITEEAEYYWRLRKIMQTPTEIMQVFRMLIFSAEAPQPLFDGATKKPVSIIFVS